MTTYSKEKTMTLTDEEKRVANAWDELRASVNGVLTAQPHGMTEAAEKLQDRARKMDIAVGEMFGAKVRLTKPPATNK